MREVGLIAGTSWHSSLLYYEAINSQVATQLGGLHSAKILIDSVNFFDIANGSWEQTVDIMVNSAKRLEQAGAEGIAICSNALHKAKKEIAQSIYVPIIDIVDSIDINMKRLKVDNSPALLLGTKTTMEGDFYRDALASRGIKSYIPPVPEDREFIHRLIFDKLCRGIRPGDQSVEFQEMIAHYCESQGTQAVILGCTELGLCFKPRELQANPWQIIDTAQIHSRAIVDFMLAK